MENMSCKIASNYSKKKNLNILKIFLFFCIYKNEKYELQNRLKLHQNHLHCFKYNIFCPHKFFRKFL